MGGVSKNEIIPSLKDIVQLAHITGWAKSEIEKMAISELNIWINTAAEFYNDLHAAPTDENLEQLI